MKSYRCKDNHFDLNKIIFNTFYRNKINFMNFMTFYVASNACPGFSH
jgi:hypothetical protein